MRRSAIFAAAVAAALAAVAAATARADTFALVPAAPAAPAVTLPSAETPNVPNSLRLPFAWTARASTQQTVMSDDLRALWQRAGAAYRIPWQVLTAINKIETNFGQNMGPSSAGAVGWMQFMPETWLRWGLDASGDGVADPWNAEDAVYAAARYLAAAGGVTDLRRAVFAYNHADWYVRDVLELAATYDGVAPDVTLTVDGLQIDLEQARANLARISEQIAKLGRVERKLGRAEERLLAKARAATLLSDTLGWEQRAVQMGVRREHIRRRIESLRNRLVEAEEELTTVRTDSSAVGMDAATATAEGWVFPVGGGPSVVSVARDHHDYPAADIAAPHGSPVYALADAVVDRAWHVADARCGIGLTLQTADGQMWTYCHLAYLDPAVDDGGVVAAGAPIGLVGSTGRSTGPHLHLQLRPATSYPQDESWFRAFAGVAFTWQDGAPTRASAPVARNLFAVAPPSAPADGSVVAFTR